MKKYLIKGLLAFIVGAFVASCADDKVDYIPIEQQKATAYAEAFKELIGGEVAPDHDWGFTKTSLVEDLSEARTRYVDVNGNMWKDHPELGPTESQDVKNWVNMTRAQMRAASHAYYENVPKNLENYWVTQVWKGTDTYSDLDNHSGILGSDKMNNLHIKQQSSGSISNVSEPDWYHVNNFNAGDDTDWWGNTLVLNSGTYDFAYHGAEDSKYHNKWIIVRGADIKQEYAGYYYVCFDFEQTIGNPTTKFQVNVKSPYRDENLSFEVEISGAYENAYQIYASGYTTYTGSVLNPTTNAYETHTWNLTEANIQWSQVLNGNQCVAANDVYTDWIIRLVDASNGGSSSSSSSTTRVDRVERRRLVDQGRIFCEDLGTNTVTTSDIDFNDAVFDAKIWRLGQYDVTYVNGNYSSETDYLTGIYPNGLEDGKFKYIAEIRLLAAGGTIPLKIGGKYGFEIHSKFGEGNGRTIGHTTIINTMGAPSQANFTTTVNTETCEAVTVEVDITELVAGETEIGLDIIPIEVQWTSGNKNTVGEISADYGKVPQKLCVPIGTPWIYERIPITSAYKTFDSYARTKSPLFWDGTKDESLLYPSNPVGMTAETGLTGNVNTNPYHDEVVIPGVPTTTTVDKVDLWLGSKAFDNDTQGSNELLYSRDIVTNDVLRVYGINGDSGNHFLEIALILNDQNWSWDERLIRENVNFSNGYIDIPITSDIKNMTNIRDYFGIWGQNVTITRIERIRTTVTH